jgi:hypothetical protein
MPLALRKSLLKHLRALSSLGSLQLRPMRRLSKMTIGHIASTEDLAFDTCARRARSSVVTASVTQMEMPNRRLPNNLTRARMEMENLAVSTLQFPTMRKPRTVATKLALDPSDRRSLLCALCL